MNGFKFKRQQQIRNFIVDFICLGERLIIEADRSQHEESSADAKRDAWLEDQGFRILGFWNNDVMHDMTGVAFSIRSALHQSSPLVGEDSEASSRSGVAQLGEGP